MDKLYYLLYTVNENRNNWQVYQINGEIIPVKRNKVKSIKNELEAKKIILVRPKSEVLY